jgi:putative membrane protein
MPTPVAAALQNWSPPPLLTLAVLVTASLYALGWSRLGSASQQVLPAWRAAAFFLGLFLIWLALASPLSVFDEQLLTVHMAQHLLLMTIAPALILLGAPVMPLLHGLPRSLVKSVLGPLLRWPPVEKLGSVLSRPAIGWLAAAAALIAWHIPAAFTLALESETWHVVEHSCFLTAGFLFWWPVVRPWPSSPAVPRWSMLLYLFLATLPCDILSGFLVFSDRVAYPIYARAPRTFAISALADQQCAAALMWMSVTVIYLVPAAILTNQFLAVRHPRDDRFLAAQFAASRETPAEAETIK